MPLNNNDRPARQRRRVQHEGGGRSRTKQSDADHTDINKILNKYVSTGVLPKPPGTARYGDFSHGMDFKTMMDRVTAAQSDFRTLPSAIRRHVDQDVGAFLDMVFDPERKEELVQLGLIPQNDPTIDAPTPAPEEANEGENPSSSETDG